jgi:hypothetical protein
MNELEKRLDLELLKLVSKECWRIVAGKGTGSVVSLQIGDKIPRKRRVDNPALPSDIQNFEGEYIVFVECVWRLDAVNEVICGAWNDNSEGGKMLKGLKRLVGQRVTSVTLGRPGFDLEIGFSNDLKLKLFCDQTNEIDNRDNYMFFTPSEIITISVASKIEVEPRN